MVYLLLVTALINGHPDTSGPSLWLSLEDCQKAETRYKAAQAKAGVKVYATACLPMDSK